MKRTNSMNRKESRLGATNTNKHGSVMVVISYENASKIEVLFEEGYRASTTWEAFNSGAVKNVYDKTIFGVGYLGEGDYQSSCNGKRTKQYTTWSAMLRRAYDKKEHEKNSTYVGCSVDKEWHNFQNFAKWFDENYYEIEGQVMNLDKDILYRGNKEYSPRTCVFVPQNINKLFIKIDKPSGSKPVGVHYHEQSKGYYASIHIDGKYVRKYFKGEQEASKFYVTEKEKYIQDIADKYKSVIPSKLYEVMVNYRVYVS